MNENRKKEIDRVLEEVIKDEDQGALDAYAEAELTSPYPEDKETAKYMKEKLAEKGITDWKIKKLTLRLDKDNVDLLTKLEKIFPSLSQNQILNYVIEHGGDKMIEVMEKKSNNGGWMSFCSGGVTSSSDYGSQLKIEGDSLIFINSKGKETKIV